MWLQLPWWKIVWCFKSRLHCTRLYIAFKLLEVYVVFWSFTCIFRSNFYAHNHVSQKAKDEISNWEAITNRITEIQVQAMFPAKKHPDCRHRWPEIQLRYRQLNAKEKPYEQKQREASWDFVYTPSIEHLFTQTSFYCGFDRYKVMACFQVQLVN